MNWSLALSHHQSAALSRCFRLGRVRLCARCSGLWPALLLGLAAQRLWFPRPSAWDLPLELALILPALWDYARATRHPQLGSNGWRAFSGVGLGLGLSRAAVLGRVLGYGTEAFVFPMGLCLSWVVLAPWLWPVPVQLTDAQPAEIEVKSPPHEL